MWRYQKELGSFSLRENSVNLESDILDVPDYFWDNDRYQEKYKKMAEYLEIEKRTEILNQRLDIIKELLDMLNDELTSSHESRLMWIIIFLLAFEAFTLIVWQILVKDIFNLLP